MIIRCGLAAASTVNTYRKLTRTAATMPRPATRIPEGAVAGDDICLRPNMNRKAATRSLRGKFVGARFVRVVPRVAFTGARNRALSSAGKLGFVT